MTRSFEAIERLLAEAEQLADPRARELARALAAALVELVGDALARVGELGGEPLARRLADDDLVGSLLVLCNRHPDEPVLRARRALEAAGDELASVGVVLDRVVAADRGVRVYVRAERGSAADPARARALIEAIVVARAPDVEILQVELAGSVLAPAGFVPVDRLRVST